MAIQDDKIYQHPRTRSKRKQVPDLMPEMITEILSRLPVKSLLQLRSVSKSWRSMISDPKFAKIHLAHSKNNEIFHSIIFSKQYFRNSAAFRSFHLSPVLNGCSDNSMGLELDYPLKHTNRSPSVRIVGSINGVICVVIDKQVSLWNPSTRISIFLPDSGIKQSLGKLIVYGFGYDESTDDYKVIVCLCHMLTPFSDFYSPEVMAYSSRTCFWKRLGDFPSDICLSGQSRFVKGSIHWLARQRSGSNYSVSTAIVSLDSATEIFGEVAQPEYCEGEPILTLCVLGECLCVLSYFHEIGTDVWMMKEYGVRESWIKLTTIRYIHGFSKSPAPLYLSKNGEILLVYESVLLLFDPQRNAFRDSNIQTTYGRFEVNTYFESLVSPLIQEGVE